MIVDILLVVVPRAQQALGVIPTDDLRARGDGVVEPVHTCAKQGGHYDCGEAGHRDHAQDSGRFIARNDDGEGAFPAPSFSHVRIEDGGDLVSATRVPFVQVTIVLGWPSQCMRSQTSAIGPPRAREVNHSPVLLVSTLDTSRRGSDAGDLEIAVGIALSAWSNSSLEELKSVLGLRGRVWHHAVVMR